MNKDSALLLLVGLLLGFLATYLLVRNRDLGPLVLRDVPGLMSGGPIEAQANERIDALIQQAEVRLEQNPGDFQVLIELANLNFDRDDFQGAIDYYGRALEINPDDATVRTDMGTALYYLDRVDFAAAEFEKSLSIDPTHPQALFNMGVLLLEERNDRAGALQLWERLIATNPGYPQIGMVREEIARVKSQP